MIRPLLVVICGLLISPLAIGQVQTSQITRSFTEPIEESVAASAEIGIIAEVHVKEGDLVQVGDLLAVINHAVLKESLAIAIARSESTAALDAAKSQKAMLESQLEAIESLVDGGHTNKFEVMQKNAEYQTAISELRAAQDDLKLAQLEVQRIKAQIADRTIKSPINGFVTELHKQLGENVSNNAPEYATIVRVDKLKVRFYLSAETLRSISLGDSVVVRIGKNRQPVNGNISFVSPIINPNSGLGRLDVEIDNQDLGFQSGIVCYWGEQDSVTSQASNRIEQNN